MTDKEEDIIFLEDDLSDKDVLLEKLNELANIVAYLLNKSI